MITRGQITISNWEDFFKSHAQEYMDNSFTKNTLAEVDFIEGLFQLPKESHLLDMGCGTGRHSIELVKRGYQVTGVDVSRDMLKEAQKKAAQEGVSISFLRENAIHYREKEVYDGAICLCEGAFSLLGEGDDPIERDLIIMKNISYSLKAGAPFLLTALNAFRKIRNFTKEDVEKGVFIPEDMVDWLEMYNDKTGEKFKLKERGYLPTELRLMARLSHLKVLEIWGGTAGHWRKGRLQLDEIEIMVFCRKNSSPHW